MKKKKMRKARKKARRRGRNRKWMLRTKRRMTKKKRAKKKRSKKGKPKRRGEDEEEDDDVEIIDYADDADLESEATVAPPRKTSLIRNHHFSSSSWILILTFFSFLTAKKRDGGGRHSSTSRSLRQSSRREPNQKEESSGSESLAEAPVKRPRGRPKGSLTRRVSITVIPRHLRSISRSPSLVSNTPASLEKKQKKKEERERKKREKQEKKEKRTAERKEAGMEVETSDAESLIHPGGEEKEKKKKKKLTFMENGEMKERLPRIHLEKKPQIHSDEDDSERTISSLFFFPCSFLTRFPKTFLEEKQKFSSAFLEYMNVPDEVDLGEVIVLEGRWKNEWNNPFRFPS